MAESALVRLGQRYEEHPLLKALVKSVPIAGPFSDAMVGEAITLYTEQRLRTFYDELAEGKFTLSPDLIKSEEFLFCHFATQRAALRERRQEKVKLFARLLKPAVASGFKNIDEYEEYMGILEELTYRELVTLITLRKFGEANPAMPGENDLQRATRFGDEFCAELARKTGIPSDEIDTTLTRLNRTGCYETFT